MVRDELKDDYNVTPIFLPNFFPYMNSSTNDETFIVFSLQIGVK